MSLVLVVDDHNNTCRLLQRYLRAVGRQTCGASSGEAAIRLLETTSPPPDLILLDVMMPGMDGFETLAALRAMPAVRGVPIVMLSAVSDDESRARAKSLGAADYWVKGAFNPAHFEQMLDRHAPKGPAAVAA